jgi:hypothetical protein
MAAHDQPPSDTAGLDDAIRPQDEAVSVSPGRSLMNDAKADRTHSDGKAIPEYLLRCRMVSRPLRSFLLVMLASPEEDHFPRRLPTERVACRAAGKRTQPAWMWMVAKRVCPKLEKSVP